jgi:hypothetical protein
VICGGSLIGERLPLRVVVNRRIDAAALNLERYEAASRENEIDDTVLSVRLWMGFLGAAKISLGWTKMPCGFVAASNSIPTFRLRAFFLLPP